MPEAVLSDNWVETKLKVRWLEISSLEESYVEVRFFFFFFYLIKKKVVNKRREIHGHRSRHRLSLNALGYLHLV